MRRILTTAALISLVLMGLVFVRAMPSTSAQDATPAGDEAMTQEGVTFEPVTLATGVEMHSPAELFVVRIGLARGHRLREAVEHGTIALGLPALGLGGLAASAGLSTVAGDYRHSSEFLGQARVLLLGRAGSGGGDSLGRPVAPWCSDP